MFKAFSIRSLVSVAAFLPLSLSAGCFTEPKPECAFACGDNSACPTGYRCTGDGWCKRDDVAEDFACSTVSLIDASSVDASLVDADPTEPDANSDAMPAADATPVYRDAMPVDPDATLPAPDAQPVPPDAQPVPPDAQPVPPDAQPVLPDAMPGAADAEPALPDAMP